MNNWQRNLPVSKVVEQALARREGVLTQTGALAVWTGKYTGRSPQDRFVVRDTTTEDTVDWGKINQPFDPERFDALHRKIVQYLSDKEVFVFDGYGGHDPNYRLPIRVINEFAWQNLFIRQLLVRAKDGQPPETPRFTLYAAPGFTADPQTDGTRSESFILIDLTRGIGLIGGTRYAGEMKKMIFTVLNFLLLDQGVLPMHCAANIGDQNDVALFFGLSGTGKTSLSTDETRRLIGDDEHGWTERGIFNFEGGCYAKTIGLSKEDEPQIWDAIRFGAVLENVVVEESTREVDFDSRRYTENTRAAYPIDYIPNAVEDGLGGHPNTIFFLTADASGVLPPIAKLSEEQAIYYFLSGYTSKLAGTERGVNEPEATFSACFGAPFLPRRPMEYAELLMERLRRYRPSVFLVNTGWTGGPYGVGRRISLEWTRSMVRAAIQGMLDDVPVTTEEYFGLAVPTHCPGVPDQVLDQRSTWNDPSAYDQAAKKLQHEMKQNFATLVGVPREIEAAGPK